MNFRNHDDQRAPDVPVGATFCDDEPPEAAAEAAAFCLSIVQSKI